MIEKEIKILLNRDEYKNLLNEFSFQTKFCQTNHYYCTDLLSDITIRIRSKNGKNMLQIKIPKKKEGNLHIKQEFEKEIFEIKDVIEKKSLEDLSAYSFSKDAVYIGKLVTERRICTIDNVEMALDANTYLGKTDYELELEYKGEYPSEIVEKVRDLNININQISEGKNTRFCNRLKEVNKPFMID